MRRGFLVGKNKKPETDPAQRQRPEPHLGQKIFAEPQHRYDTPGAAAQADDEFKCTIIPRPPQPPLFKEDNKSGGGPYSLCLFHGRQAELAILSTPGFPSAVPNPTRPRYILSGGGMLAAGPDPIANTDFVIAERPLFLIPAIAFGVPLAVPPSSNLHFPDASAAQITQLQMRQYNLMLEKCLARLTPADRRAFYEFPTHDRKEGLGPVLDRMEMNALAVGFRSADDGRERYAHLAIFKCVSRIRHRCKPNATWDFDVASFSMHVRALCPIGANEEIFISYIDDASLTGRERREKLEKYGISCGCELCTGRNIDA